MPDSSPCIIPDGFFTCAPNPVCHEQERGGDYSLDGMKALISSTVRRSAPRPWRLAIRGARTITRREKLLDFHAHVAEFSKVLIEGGDWRVFGRRGRRNQAVHEMNLRFSIAI